MEVRDGRGKRKSTGAMDNYMVPRCKHVLCARPTSDLLGMEGRNCETKGERSGVVVDGCRFYFGGPWSVIVIRQDQNGPLVRYSVWWKLAEFGKSYLFYFAAFFGLFFFNNN